MSARSKRPKRQNPPNRPAEEPVRRHSLVKRIAFRVLAVAIGLVAGVVLAEAGLRIFHVRPERYAAPKWSAWDGTAFREGDQWGNTLIRRPSPFADAGVTMGEYVPGARFELTYASNPRGYFDADNAVVMTVNALGLRGEETAAQKPAGAFRILGLGDSYTFGYGVKDEDTFLHRLEARLNAGTPGQKRYETLNAGVGGYNTRDEVVYLEHRWLDLDPDLVVIVFYINDAYDDNAILNMGQGFGTNQTQPAGPARYSYVWDLIQHRYQTYQESKTLEEYYKKSYFADARQFLENPGQVRVDWTVCRSSLERAAEITRQRKVKLALVMFPELYGLNGRYPFEDVHALVKETCGRLGIAYLDLLDTFRGHDPRSLWVHPSDHHPNETAHAMAAEAIERFLRDERLLDRPKDRSGAEP